MRTTMGFWTRVKGWLSSAPDTDVQHRTHTTVFEIDGVSVPGSGFQTSFYRPGMSIPGAWRCAIILSDFIGEIPWHAYRERGDKPVERLNPTPPLLDNPNPQETRMSTFSSWGLDLIWHGNAIGIIAARNNDGWPTAVLPVPVRMVGIRRNFENTNLPIGVIEYNVGGTVFPEWDVIHVKGPCEPGEIRGIGVLEAHLSTLNLAQEQTRQASSIANHGVPTGLLKATAEDITTDELVEAKKFWLEQQRDRTISALAPGVEFEPLAWNPEELQLLDARKFMLHELGLIFGVPLSFLGAEQSNRTYRNDEMESINLLKFALGGHLARFEHTFTRHMPNGTWAKANVDSILRSDTLSRYQAHAIGIDAGFLTVNEVREIEDRPPLASGEGE